MAYTYALYPTSDPKMTRYTIADTPRVLQWTVRFPDASAIGIIERPAANCCTSHCDRTDLEEPEGRERRRKTPNRPRRRGRGSRRGGAEGAGPLGGPRVASPPRTRPGGPLRRGPLLSRRPPSLIDRQNV